MFELRSKTKWYWPLESDFIAQPPSPLEFPGPLTPPPPPTSLKFPIPSVVGVWIFSVTCTHCLKIYILLHILNKNENIVNVGYWVLSKNLRNFRCNISVRHPSIQSLVGREGNKVSAHRGVEYVIFSWWEIVQEMAHSFLSSSKTCLLYKLLFKYFIA